MIIAIKLRKVSPNSKNNVLLADIALSGRTPEKIPRAISESVFCDTLNSTEITN